MASEPRPRLTEEQYLEIERKAHFRSEFIDGRMYPVGQPPCTPGNAANHARIQVNLARELSGRIEATSCEVFNGDLGITVLATGHTTKPDASIVCGELEFADALGDAITNPVVLIEVLSPGSEAWDRGGKWHHYQLIPTLREYLVVSQHQPTVDRFVRQDDGKWLLDTYRGLNAELPIEAAGIRVPLAGIYRGVSFEQTAIS